MWIAMYFELDDRVVVRASLTHGSDSRYNGQHGRVVDVLYGGPGRERVENMISVEFDGGEGVDFLPQSLFIVHEDADKLMAAAVKAAQRKVDVRVSSP